MKVLSILSFLCSISFSLSAQYWQVIEQSPMPERVANNAVVEGFIDGVPYLYSFGGIDSTKTRQGIHLRSYRYNTSLDLWENIPPLPDTLGKIAAGASRIGDIIYIIGGYHVLPGVEISSNRVHRYDIKNNVYLSDGAPIPTAIDDQVQAVWRDSMIFVVTGWRGNMSTQGNVPNVQIYNPDTDEWIAGSNTPNNDIFKAFGASGVIIGDTIFYYGGANETDFGITGFLRKGLINPTNPKSVAWLAFNGDIDHQGYRMAASSVEGNPYWLGGSSNTYNFDGIAYDGTGPVPPSDRSLFYDLATQTWQADLNNALPMDLRGVGEISDTVKYLAGGMLKDQWVSNKTYRLERSFVPDTMVINSTQTLNSQGTPLSVFPNPTTGLFQIQLTELAGESVVFFDGNGREVFKQKIKNLDFVTVDLSTYPNGIYWVKIGNKAGRIVKME